MIYKSFLEIQTNGISNDNEWQRVTMSSRKSDNKWYNEWQRTTTIGITSDKEWQRMIQRVTTSDNKWQWVTACDSSGITNESGTEHFIE